MLLTEEPPVRLALCPALWVKGEEYLVFTLRDVQPEGLMRYLCWVQKVLNEMLGVGRTRIYDRTHRAPPSAASGGGGALESVFLTHTPGDFLCLLIFEKCFYGTFPRNQKARFQAPEKCPA